jgi:hypothetical protein
MNLEQILPIGYMLFLKLGIIAAGTCSIICGYKLFKAGIYGKSAGNSAAELKGADWTVQIKAYGPGLFFAAFGMILIVVMMCSAPPAYNQILSREKRTDGSTSEVRSTKVRSENDGFLELVNQAHEAYSIQNIEVSISSYEKALLQIAEPLNDLAVLYSKKMRHDEAYALAELASKFAPGNSKIQQTFDQIKKERAAQ